VLNKTAFKRIDQQTKNESVSSGMSKSPVALALQKAAQSQTDKEQLEAQAAMVESIFYDLYVTAVKYDENGYPALDADGDLQFEPAFLPAVAESAGFYLDILKMLAKYPPDMDDQEELPLGESDKITETDDPHTAMEKYMRYVVNYKPPRRAGGR
jgi:hypothetical protein